MRNLIAAFLFCFTLPVIGFAKMAYQPFYEVHALDVKNYLDGVVKTRPLNANETQLQKLSQVAKELKVESYLSYNKDPSHLQPQNISDAMIKKMQEHPKWDVTINSQIPHLDLLKNTYGEKSYGWAWFLNQRGEKAGAKKILVEVFEEGFQKVMEMRQLHFNRSSPLAEIQFVQKALAPMLNSQENEIIDSKMQKMKNHFSNLPSSNIKT